MSGASLPTQGVPPSPLPHSKAFEHLVGGAGNESSKQLRALVAFGLYAEAECRWAASSAASPRGILISQWNEAASAPHALGKLEAEAERLLQDFSNAVVDLHQRQALQSVVADVTEAMHRTPRSFWHGTLEALAGAALYTTILIFCSIVATRFGVDLLEVYGRLAGHK